jgi:hypothetical protein
MLGKLLKYDLRSMLKSFLLIWGGVLAISLVNHFTLNADGRLTGMLGTVSVLIPILLYAAVIISMIVLTLIFIIQRFYNGLLRDEGYLMFTLPVRPWQLVTSKGLSAVIITLLSVLVGAVSVLLLMPWATARDFLRSFFSLYGGNYYFTTGQMVLLSFEGLLLVLVSAAKSIYQIYAAIALGHLFRRHRVGMAFVMYLVISTVLAILGTLGLNAVFSNSIAIRDTLVPLFNGMSVTALTQSGIWFLIAISAVQLIVFHIITERVLSKRLNLE